MSREVLLMNNVRIALASLWNRKLTALLTVLSLAISVALLLAVETLREQARESFTSTVSGTDLIVGARGGPLQLLLYSVFHIGDATNNVSSKSYQLVAQHPMTAWSIPIALGDSHRGHRVIGTQPDMFIHFHYGDHQALQFKEGAPFNELYDVVLGADVARKLQYAIGDEIVLAHGVSQATLAKHDDKPFKVVGILKPTGTPLDNSLLVSLAAIEAIHVDWQSGTRIPGQSVDAATAGTMDLTPKTITAFLVGVKKKVQTFELQRQINDYQKEALTAILPGVVLAQLWNLVGVAENALRTVSWLVAVSGIIGMITSVLTSLNERRREMAILRALGARPWHIIGLLMSESLLLALAGCVSGILLFYLLLGVARPVIESQFGLLLPFAGLSAWQWQVVGIILAVSLLASLLPAWRAYRQSLADGLSIKV